MPFNVNELFYFDSIYIQIFYVDDPNLSGHYKVVNKMAHRGNYSDFSTDTVPRPSYQVSQPYQDPVPSSIQPVEAAEVDAIWDEVDGDGDEVMMINSDEDDNEDDRFMNDDEEDHDISDEEDLNDEEEFNDEILSSDEED
jgi:hypothetical protein